MTKLNLVRAVNQALRTEMDLDQRVLVLGEDVGENGGVFRATEDLWDRFGADRVIDTPLAESGIIGTSIGLAAAGLRPVAEIQFMGFIYPAFDQLISHAARLRNRSRGRFTCPMVVRAPYGGGIHAPEHHSESTESFFMHTPGLKVVIPSTPYDAKGLLIAAIRDPDPVIFLEPKRLYRAGREDVPDTDYTLPIGEAAIRQEGSDVTLIAWGAMMRVVLEAAAELQASEEIAAEVIDLRSLYPLDTDTIIQSVRKTGRVVIVHEAPKTGGAGAELMARINDEALLYLEAPMARVTGFDIPMPLLKREAFYLPHTQRVVSAVREVVHF